jgi:hypothetical protein
MFLGRMKRFKPALLTAQTIQVLASQADARGWFARRLAASGQQSPERLLVLQDQVPRHVKRRLDLRRLRRQSVRDGGVVQKVIETKAFSPAVPNTPALSQGS